MRYFHFGEGEYDTSEEVIRLLLAESGKAVGGRFSNPEPQFFSQTPEIYLGYRRTEGFSSAPGPTADKVADYHPAGEPKNSEWNLSGKWTFAREYVISQSDGVLELGFNARNVFLVVEPEEPGGIIEVKVDGLQSSDTKDVTNGVLFPDVSRLYQLVGLNEPGGHVLRLDVKGKLRLFAFTFG